MNSEALIHEFAPKPKINRLPSLPPTRVESNYSNMFDGNVIKWAAWLFLPLALIFVIYQYSSGLSVVSKVSPDDARLLELINSSEDVAKFNDSTLYFRDNEGIIVGDMVKIASESEKMIPNKIHGDGSRPAEHDLLSILSKY